MAESESVKPGSIVKGLNHPLVRVITRRFWGTVFTLIIAFAVIVQLGRQAFPLLHDYQDDIIDVVAQSLGVKIAVKKLEASWSGLRPKITLEKVYVRSIDDVAIFKVDAVTAELSLVSSIANRRFSWRQLLFTGFDARMVQDVNGRWAMSGMEAFKAKKSGRENFKFDDPYDLFLFGRRIEITDANFHLNFQSGERTTATIPSISIENDKDFHRLLANIDIDNGQRIFTLVVEGDGDPRNKNFVANGYLELNRFSTHNILETFSIQDISLGSAGHTTDMKLWFRSDHQKGTTLRGSLHAQGEITHRNVDLNLPHSVRADFHGKAGKEDGWRLTMQNFELGWPDFQSPTGLVGLYGDFRGLDGIRVAELDLEKWLTVIEQFGVKNKALNKTLDTLKPRGVLHNVNVNLLPKEAGYFRAQAQAEDVSTQAYMGAPAFTHVNGYLNFSAFDGFVNVDSNEGFILDLPKVYHEPMVFDRAQGQVRWKIDLEKHAAYLSTGVVSVEADNESANGYFNMTLPFSKDYGEQEMTLVIGLEKANALSHKKYVPKTIPDHLYAWLGESVKEGAVSDVNFMYHGSVQKDPEISPSIQLSGNVKNTTLEFDKNWPVLEEITGSVLLDNNKLDVNVDQAVMLENNVFNASLNLIDNPDDEGLALLINGESASDVKRAMALVNKSPLRENIGDTFDDWVMSGDVTAKLKLIIPLESNVRGEYQKVDISVRNAAVDITSLDIQFQNLSGKLHYYSDKGLFSNGLKAGLWGKQIEATLTNPKNSSGSRDIMLDFSGALNVGDLNAWLKRPELDFALGTTNVNGTLFIPSESSADVMMLSARSSLKGVEIGLPPPFGKTKETEIFFSSDHRFYENNDELRLTLGKALNVALLLPHTKEHDSSKIKLEELSSDESALGGSVSDEASQNINSDSAKEKTENISAVIHINQSYGHARLASPVPSTQRFDIKGSLDALVLDRWLEVKDQYFKFAEKYAEDETAEEDDLAVSYVLDLRRFFLSDVEIENIAVKGERKSTVWDMQVSSDMLSGNIRVPEDDSPIAMELNYLRIKSEEGDQANAVQILSDSEDSEESASEEVPYESVLADADLAQAIPLLFATKEFSVDDQNYGAWSFMLTPIDDGVELFNIVATSRGMLIGQGGESASLIWKQKEGKQSTRFKGDLSSTNLANVFEQWDYDKLVYSKSANFSVDAYWPGAPDEVSLKNIEGLISLDMKNGSFSRGAESDENALLRLIALFNFDTILRRLRLDFSDLAAQGYAFDRVTGKFDFREGKVFLTDPLKVKSSSSDLQLAGIIDMVDENVDAEIVVTLPVASNVALATALVVNLPAALGVYVMSKLFKKQLDKASSVTIDIDGDWEDPKVKVKKIFDTDSANKKGQKIKDENFNPIPEKPLEEK